MFNADLFKQTLEYKETPTLFNAYHDRCVDVVICRFNVWNNTQIFMSGEFNPADDLSIRRKYLELVKDVERTITSKQIRQAKWNNGKPFRVMSGLKSLPELGTDVVFWLREPSVIGQNIGDLRWVCECTVMNLPIKLPLNIEEENGKA